MTPNFRRCTQHFFANSLLVIFLPLAALPTQASPPTEKRFCTDQPRSSWQPEANVRKRFGPENFATFKHKVSSTRCYEYYGVRKDSVLVEAYYDPVTAEIVKQTEVAPGGHVTTSGRDVEVPPFSSAHLPNVTRAKKAQARTPQSTQ